METKLWFGSDHAGLSLKKVLLDYLPSHFPQLLFEDLGCFTPESVDYPDFAARVATQVSLGKGRGVLICGSGIGMSIAANKFNGVRAAEAWDVTSARLSREHNDANILCLGARLVGPQVATDLLHIWLTTTFLGGRHVHRIEKIQEIEKKWGVSK